MSRALFDVPENARTRPIRTLPTRSADGVHTLPVSGWSARPATRSHWAARYRLRLFITDFVAIGIALSTQALLPGELQSFRERLALVALTSALWLVVLAAVEHRSSRAIGTGVAEFKAVVLATLVFLGLLALASLVLGTNVHRYDVLPEVPVGLALLLIGRWSWRRWLAGERAAGRNCCRVVLVGSDASIAHTAEHLTRHPAAGYVVVGSVTSSAVELGGKNYEKLFSDLDTVLAVKSADTVMITSNEHLSPERMRRLSWQLEVGAHRLVVAPGVTEVAGSRIQTQPVAGLPLIHIDAPTYTGLRRLAKRCVDVVGSAILLIALSPLFAVIAIVVKATSSGPVLYRQERIGARGKSFGIFKFRSMVVDADASLAKLLAAQGTSDSPLFKVQSDPRLTKVGPILRRYSLDELPQLLNVLIGDMSLVGPRPQRPAEVALYDTTARRRLAVRPGMTGLWQVSGRSRLSWDESLRLDLYYIENWTLAADLVIMWRTAEAVVGSDGAY